MSLKREEWPAKAIGFMADEVIEMAQEVREETGVPMIPSPDSEAHVRFSDGKGLHCIGLIGGGKSHATDLFLINNSDAATFLMKAQSVAKLGGFGIYFDTHLGGHKRVMAHLDTRARRLLWLCPDEPVRRYVYYDNDPVLFLNLLAKELSKL
jgi:hypothetical protein|tara:strand:- start:282 stop:737 length:456 start_codon:yes stop_codon:yes gene_type:complete